MCFYQKGDLCGYWNRFPSLAACWVAGSHDLWSSERIKSHIRIAFGVVQLEGKRQLYPDIADLENFGFYMTLFLLTYLNATDVLLLCARQNTSLDLGPAGAYRLSWAWCSRPGARDRPNPWRYDDHKARAVALKSMEEFRKYTQICVNVTKLVAANTGGPGCPSCSTLGWRL